MPHCAKHDVNYPHGSKCWNCEQEEGTTKKTGKKSKEEKPKE